MANKTKLPHTDPGVYADIFIEEMQQQTGCSEAFLVQARPALIKLYRDVKGEALENCLNDVRELIQQQAETERICAKAKEDAQKLDQMQMQLDSDLRNMRQQVNELRNTLQATSLILHMKNRFVGEA